VACPEGKEAATCTKVRQIISPEILEDAFVPRKENQFKRHGVWKTEVIDFFKGYFVVATKDAPALSRALSRLTFPVHMVGAMGHGYRPLSEDAQRLLEQTMDKKHVVRLSWGEIVSDNLRVQGGPLVGKEDRVAKFNRRRAWAYVRVGEGDGASSTLSLPLAILARR
jgi:transcriptional antiterminator NusG